MAAPAAAMPGFEQTPTNQPGNEPKLCSRTYYGLSWLEPDKATQSLGVWCC